MTSIGHPIVGDKAYGGKVDSQRIMLHAEKVSYTLHGNKYVLEVKTPSHKS